MELTWSMSIQHLINLHNVGVRFIALELVTSAIKAKNEPARTLPARSVFFIGCMWHVFYIRGDEQTEVFERIEQKGRRLKKETLGLLPSGYMRATSKSIHVLHHR